MAENAGTVGKAREVKDQLVQLREQLEELSLAIWQDIDHDDPTRLEEGVRFKKSYNERRGPLTGAIDQMLALLREYPSSGPGGGVAEPEAQAAEPAVADVAESEAEAAEPVVAGVAEPEAEVVEPEAADVPEPEAGVVEPGAADVPESGAAEEPLTAADEGEEIAAPSPPAVGLDQKVPFGFVLDGQTFTSASTWPLFYETLLQELYLRAPEKFGRLADASGGIEHAGRPLFARVPDSLGDPLPIADSIFADADFPPQALLQVIKHLIKYMGYSLESFKILLKEKDRGTVETLSLAV